MFKNVFDFYLFCICFLIRNHFLRGEQSCVKERGGKRKEVSDRYVEEQKPVTSAPSPTYPPPPKHTHPHPPQEAGKEEVSYIDVHLIWWFPTCMWEQTQREEGAEKISGVRPPDPRLTSTQQPPSSQHELPTDTGNVFSHSLIPPPAPELILSCLTGRIVLPRGN